MFYTKTINKELKSVPFERAFEIYEFARKQAIELAQEACELEFQRRIERLEQEYTSTHEAPSEVSFADQVSYPKLDLVEVGRKAGQRALVEEFIPLYKLEHQLQAVYMEQIVRYLANTPIHTTGLIDPRQQVQKIFNGFGSEWDRGLYLFLMLDSRSSWLKAQYKGEARNYCSLVPIILYAYKRQYSVPYSRWSREGLHWAVNKSLCDAMLCEPPQISRDEILQIREQGLRYKSGEREGQLRKAETTYKLYGVSDTALGHLPELAQAMIAQIWCAHPTNRTKYMVLDPLNWDNIPTPLLTPNVWQQDLNIKPTTSDVSYDLPWN